MLVLGDSMHDDLAQGQIHTRTVRGPVPCNVCAGRSHTITSPHERVHPYSDTIAASPCKKPAKLTVKPSFVKV